MELTRHLVQIDSTNPGTEEGKIGEFIIKYLEGTGAQIQTEDVMPGRKNIAATVYGESDGPMLVLSCHMDTVVAGSGWTYAPFEARLEGNRIYGRGACDMKSGLACALTVFRNTAKAVKAGEICLHNSLRLLCTVDEEGDMKGIEKAIEDHLVRREDWVLDLEPTGGEIQMAHKGRLWIKMNIRGMTAHASKPEQGADAIAGAAEILHDIRKAFAELPVHPVLGPSTVTFGQIRGGYQPYVVPDECEIWTDIRLSPPTDAECVLRIFEKAMRRAEESVPGIYAEYEITGNRPYVELHEGSVLLSALKEAVLQETGRLCEAGAFPGYTDTAVIAGMTGNEECMSYGPGDLKLAHKPDEYVETEDLERCGKVLTALVKNLLVKKVKGA